MKFILRSKKKVKLPRAKKENNFYKHSRILRCQLKMCRHKQKISCTSTIKTNVSAEKGHKNDQSEWNDFVLEWQKSWS